MSLSPRRWPPSIRFLMSSARGSRNFTSRSSSAWIVPSSSVLSDIVVPCLQAGPRSAPCTPRRLHGGFNTATRDGTHLGRFWPTPASVCVGSGASAPNAPIRPGAGMRYRAFISYSHKDARWARWLHRTLEGYQLPRRLRGTVGEFGALPDRLRPIFRDRDDLASVGGLTPKIQAALADSDALVVICSPDAARSPWVNDEVLRFKRIGRGDRICCLIVHGEPDAGDERECFVPALRFELDANGTLGTQAAEPVAADVRPGKIGRASCR